MEHSDNKQLHKKYYKKQSFFKQMQEVTKKYAQFQQQALYCQIKGLRNDMLLKIHSKTESKKKIIFQVLQDWYMMIGIRQPHGDKSFEKLMIQMIKQLPRPKRSYSIIYVNTLADASAYNDFKKILEFMPIQYFTQLVGIYVLQASFISRAGNWLSFGTITNFIKSKTHYFDSISQVSKQTKIPLIQFIDNLPEEIIKQLLQGGDLILQQNILNSHKKINQNQLNSLKTNEQKFTAVLNSVGTKIKTDNQIRKQLPKTHNLDKKKQFHRQLKLISQYELGQSGAPLVIELLIFYFNDHAEDLKIEGIFRKSVSIDDENQILQQITKKNYNFISGVTNPHIIANALKRFISSFRIPLIPYQLFQQFMHKDHEPQFSLFVIQKIKELPKINKMTLYLLFDFMKQKVLIHSDLNKMNEKNMCIVIGPCIMRAETSSIQDLIYAQKIILVTSLIFKNFENIFGNKQHQTQMMRQSYRQHRRQSLKMRVSDHNTIKFRQNQQGENHLEVNQNLQPHTPEFGNKLIHKTTQYFQEKLSQIQSDQEQNEKINNQDNQKDIIQPDIEYGLNKNQINNEIQQVDNAEKTQDIKNQKSKKHKSNKKLIAFLSNPSESATNQDKKQQKQVKIEKNNIL